MLTQIRMSGLVATTGSSTVPPRPCQSRLRGVLMFALPRSRVQYFVVTGELQIPSTASFFNPFATPLTGCSRSFSS